MTKGFKVATVLLISIFIVNLLAVLFSKACSDEIRVIYQNKTVKFTNGFPMIYKDRTFLGLRSTGEMLGLKVEWDGKAQVAWVYNADRSNVVRIQMKQKKAYINDELVKMTADAMIIDNSIFVPVRFISEAFNKKVTYVGSTRTIHINENDSSKQDLF